MRGWVPPTAPSVRYPLHMIIPPGDETDSLPETTSELIQIFAETVEVVDDVLARSSEWLRSARPSPESILFGTARIASLHLDCAGFLLQHNKCSPAATLTRTAYEVAVRLFWGTREEQGPERIEQHWLKQRDTFAGTLERAPLDAAFAKKVMERARLSAPEGTGPPPAPGIEQMLREIENPMGDDGKRPRNTAHLLLYANVYRYLCAAAHGDPAESLSPDRTWWALKCCEAASKVAVMITHAYATKLDGPPVLEDPAPFLEDLRALWSRLEVCSSAFAANHRSSGTPVTRALDPSLGQVVRCPPLN